MRTQEVAKKKSKSKNKGRGKKIHIQKKYIQQHLTKERKTC